MDITITTLAGGTCTLRVQPQDTVRTLKTYIRDKMNVPIGSQRLVFVNSRRVPLDDDQRLLSSYGLQSGSQVSLLVTQPATFQVFLRNEKGTLTTYDVKPDETVNDFKTKVQHREGVQVSQQRLIHQGREMTGGLLRDYGVEAMSTIDLTFRLRGG